MDAYRNPAELVELTSLGLAGRRIARLENARGRRLRVEIGEVWITEEGSTHDAIVKAGETFTVLQSGTTLVSALKPLALVSIEPPAARRRPLGERFAAFWVSLYAPESRPTSAAL